MNPVGFKSDQQDPGPLTWEMTSALKNGDWLGPNHIYLAQELLRKQFPLIDGLKSTLSQNDGFVPIQNEGINTCKIIISYSISYTIMIMQKIIVHFLSCKVSRFIILVVTIGLHQPV